MTLKSTRSGAGFAALGGVAATVAVLMAAGCDAREAEDDALRGRAREVAAAWDKRAARTAPPTKSPIEPDRALPGHPVGELIAAEGRTVTVVAVHGACDTVAQVGVLETRRSVVLSGSVEGHQDGGLCTKQAKLQEVTVKMERPLGERHLLDAHTGRPLRHEGPEPS